MMVFLVDIADDVVVHDCVFARTEVPRLFLGVVWPALQSLELVLKVENVIGLLVAKSFVLILCKHFDHILPLLLSNLSFALWVCEGLRDRIVLHLLSLNKLAGDLSVGFGLTLEVLFRLMVRLYVLCPISIAIVQA